MKKVYFSLLIFLSFSNLYAQNPADETGIWLMYFGLNRISDDFSIHTEVQHRNYEVINDIEQLLLRTAVNYHLKDNVMLTAGYGHITSHAYKLETDPVVEHRIFEQLILRNKMKLIPMAHRFRYEQRWISEDFRQRLRYQLLINIPLSDKVIREKTLFLSIYNEIFLNVEKGNVFDRNRLYGALGYQINKPLMVQVGFLRQKVADFSKNYLQAAIFFNPDFRVE